VPVQDRALSLAQRCIHLPAMGKIEAESLHEHPRGPCCRRARLRQCHSPRSRRRPDHPMTNSPRITPRSPLLASRS
jgi:hypothetical protein